MDMRHRSTPGFDLPTVRVASRQGQFERIPLDLRRCGPEPGCPQPVGVLLHDTPQGWGNRRGTCGQPVDPQAPEGLASILREAPLRAGAHAALGGSISTVTASEPGDRGSEGQRAGAARAGESQFGTSFDIAQPVDKRVEAPGYRPPHCQQGSQPRRGARRGVDAAQNTGHNQGSRLEVLWPGIVDSLPPNQRVWLASSKPLMLAENTAVVAVPNEFTRNQLEGRLRTRIEDTLSERLGKPVRLAVSVDPDLDVDGDLAGDPHGDPHSGLGDALGGALDEPETDDRARSRRRPGCTPRTRDGTASSGARRRTTCTHRQVATATCRQSHPAHR